MSASALAAADGDRSDIEEIHAGLDWISATLSADAPLDQEWLDECYRVVTAVADDKFQLHPFGMNGYRGIKAGGCFAGTREDGHYCQLSGAHAQAYAAHITRPDLHISRLDIAVTVRFVTMPNQLGESHYAEAIEADRRGGNSNRHRKIWYMSGSDGGYTLYVGAPSSDQRCRIYNKEVQSDTSEFSKCWRYEVVYKNAAATLVFNALKQLPQSSRSSFCVSLVGEWCSRRGIHTNWLRGYDGLVLPIARQTPSDAEKRLKWLETQVQPAVAWLLERGYATEVYNALGLDK